MTTRKAYTATTTTMPAAQQKCRSTTSPRKRVKKLFISSRCTEIYILHEINVFFLCEISCETDTNMFEATFRIKLEFFWENLHRFLLKIRCSLFFQIYTKKPLNITREQKRRSLTPSLAPCSTIYTSLWSSQFWVEGLAMEVLHVRGPPLICIFLSCQDLRLQ